MTSVTERIKNIKQPRLGYLPVEHLKTEKYFDFYKIKSIDSYYKPIQGMVVDYLTRFMNGVPKEIAFKISLMGAKKVEELDNAKTLLSRINGLDEISIFAACQLVGYDVVIRKGVKFFNPVKKITPDKRVLRNIRILVNRSVSFLKKKGPVILDGFTFEGGYNKIINSGDGDYLTANTLWDFKVSELKPKSEHTLQILVYYILGIHSIHKEFKAIKKLGIYNPILNTSYTISLSDIPNDVFYNVSRDVIGYCMPQIKDHWWKGTGTSEKAINEIMTTFFENNLLDTGFNPDKYKDGIYDITVDDYWSYYKRINTSEQLPKRPKFVHTNYVKFIKNSGFIMFISVSKKGTKNLLQGGSLKKLQRPLQYYYENISLYANTILNRFSTYWESLYDISKKIKSITPNDKEISNCYNEYVDKCKKENRLLDPYEVYRKKDKSSYSFSGRVHGCIVDIDFFNHIYLNPYDGSLVPYYGPAKDMKYVCKNVYSLISINRPEMLPAFNRMIENSKEQNSLEIISPNTNENEMISRFEDCEIDTSEIVVSDINMYKISNRMKELQKIYDHHLVVAWYDDILPDYDFKEKTKRISTPLAVGETKTMSCGMTATVLLDNGDKNVTIQFEDGTIVEQCNRKKFIEGRIANPSLKQRKTTTKGENIPQKKSYVGKTATMNCGLKATVIEDFGCNNITVEFEDGLIKKNCRRDKFREGKIGHKV